MGYSRVFAMGNEFGNDYHVLQYRNGDQVSEAGEGENKHGEYVSGRIEAHT